MITQEQLESAYRVKDLDTRASWCPTKREWAIVLIRPGTEWRSLVIVWPERLRPGWEKRAKWEARMVAKSLHKKATEG